MGIEPTPECWELCAASRRHKSTIPQSEKRGPNDSREAIRREEAKSCGKVNRSDSN